ncbi:MAG: excinuclease ABC subunit UvrC [Anaerobiospirillum succiniciproducens]|uniref:excinuclease ABC subunit UvrC n=1 Tax=Anaerobiospirillum succiniciproducens TaxID=13335 RepID=UPI0026DA7F0B|nr:excinuclease ABC subunit UvrC [Anaerobiospirillum succiniciproducens]MDO4676635.1 excinuclease ABC subunit UvrC [Anaerobiospirillum succiniciproducens]
MPRTSSNKSKAKLASTTQSTAKLQAVNATLANAQVENKDSKATDTTLDVIACAAKEIGIGAYASDLDDDDDLEDLESSSLKELDDALDDDLDSPLSDDLEDALDDDLDSPLSDGVEDGLDDLESATEDEIFGNRNKSRIAYEISKIKERQLRGAGRSIQFAPDEEGNYDDAHKAGFGSDVAEPQMDMADAEIQGQVEAAKVDEDGSAELFDSKAFLKTVPNRPGCYRMYDLRNQVIYVGKAKDLKKRLSSYFLKQDQGVKTRVLVSHIAHIEFTVTFYESEALILENELIKKYQPHFNILLRDDKSYPYILLTTQHEHPGIYYHRGARRKAGEYFGPFPDSSAVKDSLRLMLQLFPIRQCEDTVYAHRSRPCLMAQIGKCLAPCVPMSKEKQAQYAEQVELVKLFLQGHNQELLSAIVKKMEEHAARMEFEEAAALRDQLTSLRKVQEANSIVSGIEYPLDVIGFAMAEGMACIHVLFIRNGRIFGTRSFFPKLTSEVRNNTELVLSFLSRFYLNDTHSNLIPDEVVIDLDFNAVNAADDETAQDGVTSDLISADANDDSDESENLKPGQVSSRSRRMQQSILPGEKDERIAGAKSLVAEIKAMDNIDPQERHDRLQGKLHDDVVDALDLEEEYLTDEHSDKDTKAANLTISEQQAATIVQTTAANTDDTHASSTDAANAADTGDTVDDAAVDSAGAVVLKDELSVLKEALKKQFDKNVRFTRGVRGAKHRFVRLAMTNASVALSAKVQSFATAEHRIKELESLLGISGVERMECYDISHTQGELTVASCVVFNREGPDSSRYRRFNIDGITPGDDFAAMHQVLTRRFKDPDGGECPQLVFIDGGPGQLSQAEEVISNAFANAKTPMPTIVAVAKGEGRKEGLETLIRAFSHERINLTLNSPALQLVIHIRDESHRFAITGHRNRRAKARRTSKLESIAGVGPKRRQALLKHLGGMQEVLRAGIDELKKVPGISPKMAEQIYDELHS